MENSNVGTNDNDVRHRLDFGTESHVPRSTTLEILGTASCGETGWSCVLFVNFLINKILVKTCAHRKEP